ncbi:DNA-methyltransferase [Mycoplasma sp. VS299A]|uniref:DNA-methyltransferase n=1 Tax=Mycoplasma sp. VS299A TaxID=3401690 RepID=UPI003AAE1A50
MINTIKINDKSFVSNCSADELLNYMIENEIKVNHIITDPPYNISKVHSFDTFKNPRTGVDFGEWDKNFDVSGWIEKAVNVLDKNGSMIIFCSYRFMSYIIDMLESNNMCVKDVIVWQKSNPMPRNINRRYVQDMEFAIWAVRKKSRWVFNKPDNIPYLRSFWNTPNVSGKERTKHPTQKSLRVIEDLIKIHTNEGEIILDPFMGSGTTGVACLKNNRYFIGTDISLEYTEIALNRMKKWMK